MSAVPLCVVCNAKASTRLEKNVDFRDAMVILWNLAEVDIKRTESDKFDLCKTCFEQVEELHATHEAWQLLKRDLVTCRKKLADCVVVGLNKRKSKNLPFLGVHSKLESTLRKET